MDGAEYSQATLDIEKLSFQHNADMNESRYPGYQPLTDQPDFFGTPIGNMSRVAVITAIR